MLEIKVDTEVINTCHRITRATIAGLRLRVIGLETRESKEVITIGINADAVDGHTGYVERITNLKVLQTDIRCIDHPWV